MSKSLSWIGAGLGFLVRMGLVGLRKRSRITTVAQAAANSTNFFQRIREELPTLPSRTLRAEQGVSVSPPLIFNVMPLIAEMDLKGFRIVPAIATMLKKMVTCRSPERDDSVLMNGAWRNATYCLVLIGALYLSGCSSQPSQKSEPLGVDKSSQANDILFNALALVGTPYRYGGSSPVNGFDCSGLIQYVYRESANLTLPRTVAEMNNHAAPDIAEDSLQSGDLVIFATEGTSRPSHAGIYVGEGRFVHAPSRGGEVRMDFLDDKYWQRSYLNAKRPLACC